MKIKYFLLTYRAYIFFLCMLFILIFSSIREARAEELNDIEPNHRYLYANVRATGSYSWLDMINGESSVEYDDVAYYTSPALTRAGIAGSNYTLYRTAIGFDLSEVPEGAYITSAKIYAPYSFQNSTVNSKTALFAFTPLSSGNSAYSDFGSTILSSEFLVYPGVGYENDEFYELNEDGIEYLQSEFENASTSVKIGVRISFDYENITPNTSEAFHGISYPATMDITYTMTAPTPTPNLTLTYPQPASQNTILINKPISLYTLNINGTCTTNGSDMIYVHTQANSYIPDVDDFTSSNIDCTSNTWSTTLSDLDLDINYITVWSKDFLIEERDPEYFYDYINTEVYLYANMSYDPAAFPTTSPTSTLDSPWIATGLDTLPLIGSYIERLFNHIITRFPWGYVNDLWDIWKDADPSSQSTLGFEVELGTDVGVNATSTLDFVLLPHIAGSNPWYDNPYEDKLNSIEAKVTPWIWVGWGWVYLGVIYRIFRKKINHQ